MNRSLILFAVLSIHSISVFAGETNELARLKTLISTATAYAEQSRCQSAANVVDRLKFWHYKPEFRALQNELHQSWRLAVSHLDDIAPTDMEKTIVLCSCWEIPEDEFIDFLNAIAQLTEDHKLSLQIFKWSKTPFVGPFYGYLLKRHADPEVRAFVLRSRRILENNPNLTDDYDPVRAKKDLRAWTRTERRSSGNMKPLDVNKQKTRGTLSNSSSTQNNDDSSQERMFPWKTSAFAGVAIIIGLVFIVITWRVNRQCKARDNRKHE